MYPNVPVPARSSLEAAKAAGCARGGPGCGSLEGLFWMDDADGLRFLAKVSFLVLCACGSLRQRGWVWCHSAFTFTSRITPSDLVRK